MLFAGCASVPPTLSVEKFYKRDLKITVNGKTGQGAMVVPRKDAYEISIESAGDLDLLTYSTCHREVNSEDAGGGFFKSNKKGSFTYRPMANIESEGGCPLRISALDAANSQNSWGIIEFQDPAMELQPQLFCNGENNLDTGVTICQSHVGLIQEIHFDEPVKYSALASCDFQFQSSDEKNFKYTQPPGECVIVFKGKTSGKMYRLLTLGYDGLIVRKN